ncbi:MAG: GspH/FimT family pseudopilin [Planctomycetaceae bacterium]|nr:GspH/FimT family pseudopilin [Planctomycetaceae bacterium]
MPPRGVRPPGPGGFSFIELMVVLAILSFAFTYAVLHLDGATGEAKLSAAARQVGSSIEFLKGQAVQSHTPLELHIHLETGQWESVIPLRPADAQEDRRTQEEIIVTEPVALPRNIRFAGVQLDAGTVTTSGTVIVTFSPLGEMTPNGFMVRLVSDEIADPDAAQFSVEVNGLTGTVDYLPGEAPFEQVVRGDSF